MTVLPRCDSVFVNMLPEFNMTEDNCVEQFLKTMDVLISRSATRLLKLRVDEIEVWWGTDYR